ncbi:MAG TPA: Maf family nucleotide pyrophosphatase [Williamwhitmania sp.]|nr:Maf family nucleotide pyrophosphatase [Williamwhitmania sp.]
MLEHKLLPYRVFLGSASPRRQLLLKELGVNFEILTTANVEETFPTNIPLANVPVYLAALKANAYAPNLVSGDILITADTVVICEDILLGKPESLVQAAEMLRFLSGKRHEVITGVTLSTPEKISTFSVSTYVYFRELTADEITFYLDHFRPLDKAGAYGIQEWIGYIGIEKIEGSYFNVMGLPVQRLYIELENFVNNIN